MNCNSIVLWFLSTNRMWQYKGNNERTKNKEIFTRTWVWGLVLRVCVRSVRIWNVRVEEGIDICADALFRNDNIDMELTTLTEGSFKELMRLATSGVEFSFNDKIYRQTDGVAMGSPLGPALANNFVGFYEKKIPEEEYPRMYFRFVDDVFSYFANQSRSVEFFERLNGLHEALRFTQEGERECSLPFLDGKVSRTDDSIITSMYRKPTFTGRYTPWDSFSTTNFKINLVCSLTNRVLRICLPSVIDEELKTLRTILSNMATLAISWPSWLQEILLVVALVLDSVLLFFKYHGWEREQTSWSEKRIVRFV